MGDNRAIGVFDSGLGGLTVVKELAKILPYENIVYFGDTGRVPYGTRSRDTIRRYAREDEAFLVSRNVKLIVAACGTVSSVAADTGDDLPVPFVEVVSHSVAAAIKATHNRKIGVLATAATIHSGVHRKQLKALLPDAEIYESSGTLLVPLVEEGWTDPDDPVVLETLRRYLQPMKSAGIDTLILGCTHFPLLSKAVRKIMGEGVALVNMGVATAGAVKKLLAERELLNTGSSQGSHRFFVSDKPQSFKQTAAILLGEEIDDRSVEQISSGKI